MAAVIETLHQWAHTGLLWVGFGTIVGLVARAILPGKDRVGALTTLFMGIGGTVVGLGLLAYFWEGHHVTPLSVTGFLVATGGASVLLFFHRVLTGNGGAKSAPHTRQHAAHTVSAPHSHRTAA